MLFHFIEVIPGLGVEEARSFYGRLEKLASSHLEKIGSVLRQKRVCRQPEIRLGNRGAEPVRYARENGIDLIIVTTPPSIRNTSPRDGAVLATRSAA